MAGTFLNAAAAILFALPYFVAGTVLADKHDDIELKQLTGTCQSFVNATECKLRLDSGLGAAKDMAFMILNTGQLLGGIGTAMVAGVMFVYVEDNGSPTDTSLYLGTILSMSGLGEFIGIMLASRVIQFPEHFGVTDIEPDDPRWIGAWWLGFPVFSAFQLVVSFLCLMFPKWFVDPQDVKRRRARRAYKYKEIKRIQKKNKEKRKRAKLKKKNKTKNGKGKKGKTKGRGKRKERKDKENVSQGSGSIPDVAHVGTSQPDLGQGPDTARNTPEVDSSRASINSNNVTDSQASINSNRDKATDGKPTEQNGKKKKVPTATLR